MNIREVWLLVAGDLEKTVMLEVSALSWHRLSVSLEHPLEESMATVEMDLSDIAYPSCKIYTAAGDTSPEYATKVFQRLVESVSFMICRGFRIQMVFNSYSKWPEVFVQSNELGATFEY